MTNKETVLALIEKLPEAATLGDIVRWVNVLELTGVEIDSGCVCVRHHVNCQDEFLARCEPQLVLQALGKSDNPRRAAVTREAHSVDGLDGRCGNWSSQPGRRAANREHGGEVGRHIQLEHSVDSRRAAVGDRDPFVQACVHKPQASHVHGPCVQLEGCRGVVRPDGHG